ncbi:MBL fold metallo-hydrolase [Sulfuriflexus sp.]|uniref:MBL fold metallo-hydrolase n=1 Tax=Sulfuriflexus sp. TaxID=2015443 RepID=UPI0028CEFA6C|nr:MBL fold metallo-hydrolase [Sulfuriflexus sp.]MDT8403296.1 MBL fold metallo-hydrolase [Sulfuriflexus sp.]
MRFASLGSGSRGNATLIEAGQTRILLDCGFSETETRKRLGRFGLHPTDLQAIVVTHEHSDHINGVGALARKHQLPVYLTHGTAAADKLGSVPRRHLFHGHDTFAIGDIELHPFPVPHDAREPAQFVFSDGNLRLGVLTDTGSCTQHILNMLGGCEALIMECNHDLDMLAAGPYPASLKARVGGCYGHLSNVQARDIITALDTSRLRHLVAAHISDKNNTPYMACSALAAGLACDDDDIQVAEQVAGLDWRDLD